MLEAQWFRLFAGILSLLMISGITAPAIGTCPMALGPCALFYFGSRLSDLTARGSAASFAHMSPQQTSLP